MAITFTDLAAYGMDFQIGYNSDCMAYFVRWDGLTISGGHSLITLGDAQGFASGWAYQHCTQEARDAVTAKREARERQQSERVAQARRIAA